MTAFPSYSTGTVSVTNGGTVVTGAGGANWSGTNVKSGDLIVIDGHTVLVVDVTDSTHLLIDAWPYTTVAAVVYEIYKTSPLRFAGGDAMAEVSTLVGALNTDGFYVFVDPDDSVPDPSYGEENQFALQPTTGKLWLKTGGVWVIYASNSPGTRMTYSTTTTDADPGAGVFRLNHATPASATAAYLDNVDNNGITVSSIFDRFDDSTSTIKGILRFQNANNANVWAQFNVTGTVVDGTGYRKVTLASGVASGSFTATDDFVLTFYRTGDAGSTGSTGSAGSNGTNGAGYGGTSTTSVLIGTGSKLFSIQSGLAYQVGNYVRASSAANGANYMEGFVTAYVVGSPTLMTVNVTKVGGSGTFADWNFSISGAPGTGDLLAANNLSDLANLATAATNFSAVRYVSQSLSTAEKAQAQTNIGVLAGAVIGSAYTTYTSNSAQSTLVPADDTVPTSTEGDSILSIAYAASSTTNKLRCTFRGTVSAAAADNAVASIFQGTTNIGSQMINIAGSNTKHPFHVVAEYTPGSTSTQSISVRVGGVTNPINFNGGSGGRLLGGSQAATLVVEEIKA